ncbi:MAG: aldehyde dehydrogenase family protein, partial [Thermaerobacter sp.]|nr:aldehyde dehydrogenase family protein [Thermaerobacter sp.]
MARAGRVFEVENPHLETVLARVTRFDADDVDQAVVSARKAFDTGDWPRASATARGKVLLALAAEIRAQADELARWEMRQVGKPIRDALGEVQAAANCFEFYAGAANKVYGHTIPVSAAGLDFTERIPLGVVALIVPWNFPLLIAAWKVAPALAAGNVVL